VRKRLNDIAYKDCVGKICKSNNCGDFKIIDAVNSAKVEVQFINTGYQTVCESGNIRKGHVKDLFAPTVFGVGVLGDKCNVSCLENGKRVRCLEYQLWLGMLHRCYSEDLHSVHPTYKDCVVSDNFKHYTFFYEWCHRQVGFSKKGFHLDKDLLVKGNKTYSENICVLVPREINNLFTKRQNHRGKYPIGVSCQKGTNSFVARVSLNKRERKYLGSFKTPEEAFYVYKQAKEDNLKFLAEKYKDVIDVRAYNTLMNYQVEITD